MYVVSAVIALIPAVFGGWYFGACLARAMEFGKMGQLVSSLIFGGLLWLSFMS